MLASRQTEHTTVVTCQPTLLDCANYNWSQLITQGHQAFAAKPGLVDGTRIPEFWQPGRKLGVSSLETWPKRKDSQMLSEVCQLKGIYWRTYSSKRNKCTGKEGDLRSCGAVPLA
ncbi:hypothetical protein CapIbe_010155 [Capra ibex]